MGRWSRALGCGCALGLLLATWASAQTVTSWQASRPGNWHTSENWDNGVPTSSDIACLTNEGVAQIGPPQAEALELWVGAGQNGTFAGRAQVEATSLVAPTLQIGSAVSTEEGSVTSAQGTFHAVDAALRFDTALGIGLSRTGHFNTTSSGRMTVTRGSISFFGLDLANASTDMGDSVASGTLEILDAALSSGGHWRIGIASLLTPGGSATVEQASACIRDPGSVLEVFSLQLGRSHMSYGRGDTKAELSLTTRSFTSRTGLWVATVQGHNNNSQAEGSFTYLGENFRVDSDSWIASAQTEGRGQASGSFSCRADQMTFAGDLWVAQASAGHEGNAVIPQGHLDLQGQARVEGSLLVGIASAGGPGSRASVTEAQVQLAPGSVLEVLGDLTLGKATAASRGSANVSSSQVALAEGTTLHVGGLLTVGCVESPTGAGKVLHASLTGQGDRLAWQAD